MSLLADIQKESEGNPRQCSIADLLDALGEKDAMDLLRALEDPSITHTAITRVLRARGHNVHDKRIAAHRRGICACAQ